MQPPPLVVKANLLRYCKPVRGAGTCVGRKGRAGLCVGGGRGVGLGEPRGAPLSSGPGEAARSIWERAGRAKTKRFLLLAAFTWGRGGGSASRAPGPWPLTPAPRRALLVPRGHFLPRMPRAGRARAELESSLILQSPVPAPPPPPAPGEDSPAGNPRPAPTPAAGARAAAERPLERGEPSAASRGRPAGPRGRGQAGRGPAARPLGRPRPGPVDSMGQPGPAPSPCRRGPSLSAEARGGNEGGCSLRLSPTLFFFLGEREGKVRSAAPSSLGKACAAPRAPGPTG